MRKKDTDFTVNSMENVYAHITEATQEPEAQKTAPAGKNTRATFLIREDLLEKLKNYCYTERITQKEGLERALGLLFRKVNEADLLERPKK